MGGKNCTNSLLDVEWWQGNLKSLNRLFREGFPGCASLGQCQKLLFVTDTIDGVKNELWWTPLSRPFFARNKLMSGGVLGLSFGGGSGSPPRAIPALESALGSHPCGALSSVPVSPV